LDAVDIASELSALVGVPVFPTDRNQVYTLARGQYLSTLALNFV